MNTADNIAAACAQVRFEDPAAYIVHSEEDQIISRALAILDARCKAGPLIDSPKTIKDYLTVRAARHMREVFAVVYLDAQNRIIDTFDEFFGTLSQCSVYPREIARRCLSLGASSVILTHNHPSGSAQPSGADQTLTRTLKASLELVDVRILDHIVTGGGSCYSFAENGLI